MNNYELNINMSNEEIERIKNLLIKDVKLTHYLLKIDDNKELDVVEYKEYENLQQRIDKAIELCNIVIKNEPLQIKPNEELLDQVCGIKEVLQGEEVKNNE